MRIDRLAVLCSLLVLGSVHAQPPAGYVSDFETLMATPAGTQLWDPSQPPGTLGQDNYYWPPGTTSVPFNAYTYAGNTLGVPPNPSGGGGTFIAGTGPAGGTFARAQRDISYGFNRGPWTFATDILILFNGTLPTAQNIGSFSTQPFPGGQSFIMLPRWTDITTATNWDADYIWFDAAGTQLTASVADPGFQSLAVNRWYRWETDVDLTSNQILEVRITDLTTTTAITNNPVGRYLLGGTTPGGPLTGFRFFAGGGVAGNTIAWDNATVCAGNVSKLPPGPPCILGPCCFPANSFRVVGWPHLGGTVTFLIDAPAGVVTPGSSLAAVAMGFVATGTPPCMPIPGVTNGALIGLPAAAVLLSVAPWAGPGSPVPFTLAMPPNMPALSGLIGTTLYTQGAFLDAIGSQVVLTEGARLILGG